MTLHWWMHWFWITYQICTCYCEMVALPMHLHASDIRSTIKSVNSSQLTKIVESSNYIPPITTSSTGDLLNNTTIPIKLHKPTKKHDPHSNMTNKLFSTTIYPLVKQKTVIDQNVTELDMNVTDNQTLINASFNTINCSENLSYISEENVNQSTIVNSERVGVESAKGSLTAAGITGITLGCVSIIGVVCAVSFIMYRNYGFNRPQVLNDRCSNPDSSGYIDDSTVRENSEEMYSLDNDSFLNSLEAMTIQNLWTDTVKHTKL